MCKWYRDNEVYITPEERLKIKDARVLIIGTHLGGVIAECALRLGFESITLVDENVIDYTGVPIRKMELKSEAIETLVADFEIVINAHSFDSDITFEIDDKCQKSNVPVIHPFAIGWLGVVTIVSPDGASLRSLGFNWNDFDLKFAKYIANYYRYWGIPKDWLERTIETYKSKPQAFSLDQTSVATWLVGGMTTNILFDITGGNDYQKFPYLYLSTIKN